MTSSSSALISGAGAAGLTLAIDLARRGVPFRLIDKADGPFAGSRGKGLQPRTQEVFEDLGVLAGILEQGVPYPPVRTYAGGQATDTALSEARNPTPDEPYAMPLMLPQFMTEGVLRARLAALGHAPQFGCELVGFDQDAEGVTARLRTAAGEETLRAGWLVGADGGRSFVRHALEIGFPGQTLPIRALVADLRIEGLSRDAWHRWTSAEGGQLALCPLAGTDLFQVITTLPPDGEADVSDAAIFAAIARYSGRDDLICQTPVWRSAFGMNARLADRYRVGRVLLCGDAAHVHPPTGGQGLNTSVQDAYNLGWKLAAVLDGAPESLIDTYEEERRPIAAGVLGLSTSLLKAAQDRLAMRRGRETQELDLTYAGSSLAVEDAASDARLVAGDRAPDAPCLDGEGATTRLFEVFQGPHWTLLGFGGPVVPARPGLVVRTDLVDHQGHIADAYGLAPGASILIRPDGYVGLVASAAAVFESYLEGVLPRTAAV